MSIASEIAETLYRELNLRLNLKTRAYHLCELEDRNELLARIKNFISQDNAGFDYDEYQDDDSICVNESLSSERNPQKKLDKIFKELEKLKKSNIEEYSL